MAPKTTSSESYNIKRPPQGISTEDWTNTPDAVRRFIVSFLKPKKPKNNFPTWFVLFLNVVIVGGLTYFLTDKVVFPCVTPPYVGSLTLALIFVTLVHFSWRYIYKVFPRASRKAHTINFKIGGMELQFDRNIIVAVLNETQPWKVSSVLLGVLLLLFVIAGSIVNLHPSSPFYKGGQPFVIQGFAIQRSSFPSPEQLAPGETLTMTVEERAIIEVEILGDTQLSCTWFIASRGNNAKTGCSIAYSALTSGASDSLTVFAQPACGSRQESASLHVAVQP